MSRVAFFTIANRDFFPGTLAAVNSVVLYHRDVDVWVVEDQQRPFLPVHRQLLGQCGSVRTVPASAFIPPGAAVDVITLKAYATRALLSRYDAIVGIDSDCVLCCAAKAMMPAIEMPVTIRLCLSAAFRLWNT